MIVISDTSPLNYLVLTALDHVLPILFGQVIAPPAVMRELQHESAPPTVRDWAATPPAWLQVRAPKSADPALELGPGETEAIGLARELGADALLIDERKGVAVASNLGLFVTGTLGVLELAAERGLIQLPTAIAAIRSTSFRAVDHLFEEMLERDRRRGSS